MELLLLNVNLRQNLSSVGESKGHNSNELLDLCNTKSKLGLCVKVSGNDAFKARVGMEDALKR